MHDQKREKGNVVVDEATRRATEEKIQRFRALCLSCETHRDTFRQSSSDSKDKQNDEIMKELDVLLTINPERYSMFNFRRELLQSMWNQKRAAGSTAQEVNQYICATLKDELKLNTAIVSKDFKVYAAFVHRKWIYAQLIEHAQEELKAAVQGLTQKAKVSESVQNSTAEASSEVGEEKTATNADPTEAIRAAAKSVRDFMRSKSLLYRMLEGALQQEKAQTEKLLMIDERNFHVWNHRRWVLAQLQITESMEVVVRSRLTDALPQAPAEEEKNTSEPQDDAQFKDEAEKQYHTRHVFLGLTVQDEEELVFSQSKINHNFSNYSAWHHRALILQKAMKRAARLLTRAATKATASDSKRVYEELEGILVLDDDSDKIPQLNEQEVDSLVRTLRRTLLTPEWLSAQKAMYCDPNDQAAWFYINFLVSSSGELARCTAVYESEHGETALSSSSAASSTEKRSTRTLAEGEKAVHLEMISTLFQSCIEILKDAENTENEPSEGAAADQSSELLCWPLKCMLFLAEQRWEELDSCAECKEVIRTYSQQQHHTQVTSQDTDNAGSSPKEAFVGLLRRQLVTADPFRVNMYQS